jgi:hypothetical protein
MLKSFQPEEWNSGPYFMTDATFISRYIVVVSQYLGAVGYMLAQFHVPGVRVVGQNAVVDM